MYQSKKDYPVAIYGAGAVANTLFRRLQKEYDIVCFCETAEEKCGGTLAGLPIYRFDDARKRFEDLHFFIATRAIHRYEIMDFLIRSGVEKELIINYQPYRKYCSCVDVESRIGLSEKHMLFCPSSFGRHRSPAIEYTGDPVQDVKTFIAKRNELLYAFEHQDAEIPEFAQGCKTCPNRHVAYWPDNKVIDDVCFSIKHKCNFHCCYCVENQLDKSQLTGSEHLTEVIELLKEMRKQDILSEKAIISVAPTEISIHPYRDFMLENMKDYVCQFTTNGAVYVEQIGEALKNGGKIFCSLDAGTPATFKKVKGVNEKLFNQVVENLTRYATDGQVETKYIFLTDINDNEQDVEGFIAACEKIKPVSIHIARDTNTYDTVKCMSQNTLDMIVYMIRLAREKGFHVNCSPLAFNKQEYDYLKSKVAF